MVEMPKLLGGRYEVGELIGRGGMAQVHLGYDTRLSRTVAIKALRSDHASDPTFLARFRREAQSAAALNHPSIVAVYDTGEETVTSHTGREVALPYIVMEYVKGRTVAEILKKGDALPINEAVQVVVGVLSALEYSHREGIIHRDIKPGNIMLTQDGKVKVMDFGIARAIADSAATMTQTNSVVGTAQYLSPEQARGEVVDNRSDLYSTGCLLYELLTGVPPFRGDSAVAVAYQHVSEAPKPAASIAPDIPDAIDRVVMKSLAKNRTERYQSAGDMRRELLSAARGGGVQAPAVSSWQAPTQVAAPTTAMPTQAPSAMSSTQTQAAVTTAPAEAEDKESSKSRTFIIAGIALLVLALGALGWALLSNREPEAPPAPETVEVPDLTGTDQVAAREILEERGLVFVLGDPLEDDEVPEGEFVASDPAIGTEVEVGSEVIVSFSSGVGNVQIPDLTTGNYTQDSAKEALEALGLTVGRVDVADVPGTSADTVTDTSPSAGTEVERGSAVDLTIASGDVVIDDVVGLSSDEAQAYLRDEVRIPNITIVEEETATSEPGTVISMDPGAGKHPYDTSITLTVAKKPAPTPTPAPTPEEDSQPQPAPEEEPAN